MTKKNATNAVSYCVICGHVKVDVELNAYDSQTGNKVKVKQCLNPQCRHGCVNIHGQHKYSTFLGIEVGSKCKRCGFISD